MNAVKKPLDQEPEKEAHEPLAQTADATAPERTGHHSPVHTLQARIEAAFSARSESRVTRIITMLAVMALSTWIAALVLQSGV